MNTTLEQDNTYVTVRPPNRSTSVLLHIVLYDKQKSMLYDNQSTDLGCLDSTSFQFFNCFESALGHRRTHGLRTESNREWKISDYLSE